MTWASGDGRGGKGIIEKEFSVTIDEIRDRLNHTLFGPYTDIRLVDLVYELASELARVEERLKRTEYTAKVAANGIQPD